MRRPTLLVALLVSTTAYALPPGSPLKQGANHHIGDESFIEKFGRPPTDQDAERVRMTTHLQHVRDWLASRPATRPDLAAKRAAILASFDAYIAKGTTPKNLDLPWRTPVFIDEEGTICAVGYLIEQSVGRELPEKIARTHRYDFIEDIAADMPEVKAWVEQSGFTLEEIASIQPAYSAPQTEAWRTWDLAKFPAKDGPSNRYGEGRFKRNRMEGEWKVYNDDKERIVVGKGELRRGAGAWTSFYPTGEKLAAGRFANNEPDGRWRIWHKSGNLAAEGSFTAGTRTGKWRFYYDTPAKTPIAVGRFASDGAVTGRWNHFDNEGKLLARSWTETPSTWVAVDADYRVNGGEGSMLEVLPGADGVHHAIHQGTPGKDTEYNLYRLESFSKGKERLYIANDLGVETMFGADGTKLTRDDAGTWHATSCHWSATRKLIAAEGDLPRLHGLLTTDAARRARATLSGDEAQYSMGEDPGPACSGAIAISPARAARLDALWASRDKIRAATPQMVRSLVLRQEDDQPADPDESDSDRAQREAEKLEASDLSRVLSGSMAMFIEWPHVDRRFDELYATVAGRYSADWANHSEEDDDVNYVDPPSTN